MLTNDGDLLEHKRTELAAVSQRHRSFDERMIALVRLMARSAAARDHALQIKIEKAAEEHLQKGNT